MPSATVAICSKLLTRIADSKAIHSNRSTLKKASAAPQAASIGKEEAFTHGEHYSMRRLLALSLPTIDPACAFAVRAN
jgi:hypothetical protein